MVPNNSYITLRCLALHCIGVVWWVGSIQSNPIRARPLGGGLLSGLRPLDPAATDISRRPTICRVRVRPVRRRVLRVRVRLHIRPPRTRRTLHLGLVRPISSPPLLCPAGAGDDDKEKKRNRKEKKRKDIQEKKRNKARPRAPTAKGQFYITLLLLYFYFTYLTLVSLLLLYFYFTLL